ncbi:MULTISPECIES: HAD-IIA family hydrolase [Aerococcus]|uniref:HAD-IIA family hydrolase n=1 Tax=Aerococcus sanguinicola TaxID=119206 RepID=A0A5N1GQF0_9LACT|nr:MULTISPECIES: HAD-IIA family hydrolase [Aerococcus]KAA9300940.1 HAD-IIA family hydrolase [Aerococcus sanguinicola]MDK6369173.1 HAD-IIA family hydrolase [Aerococcus sp. UMB9870]MDK6679767.1 HAD-IIA family hydrolase [Aerococcus sp. UMB8608]MDK6686666.1 HAD-IIA family hydrolase [Aerococcus sp. UMB8623]MDK6939689.1 HAD-IIA family hydrolase [Aerococcus sp. UMB8487]
MKKKRAMFLDLDGTVYKGKRPIPGAREWIADLRASQTPFLFVTNNSMRSHQEAAQFMADYHQIDVQPDQVYTSVDALSHLLVQEEAKSGQKAYVMGSDYLKATVTAEGYQLTVDPLADPADLLVMGLDQSVTYQDLAQCAYAAQSGAKFYLTNPDIQFPSSHGFVPGAGALGQLVAKVARTEPIVCGKPSPNIILGALEQLGLEADEVVMLGDNLTTDILAANRAGLATILIETGVHQRDDIEQLNIEPTWLVKDYQELMDLWPSI